MKENSVMPSKIPLPFQATKNNLFCFIPSDGFEHYGINYLQLFSNKFRVFHFLQNSMETDVFFKVYFSATKEYKRNFLVRHLKMFVLNFKIIYLPLLGIKQPK